MASKAIFAKCFQRVAASGKLGEQDVQRLQDIYTEQFFLARRGGLPLPEAIAAAKKGAGARAKIDKGLQQYRAAKQLLATAENYGYANANRGVHRNVMDSVARKLMQHHDGKGRTQSVEVAADGIYKTASSALGQMVEAVGNKFGLIENGQRLRLFVEAMFGNKTGDAKLDGAAESIGKMFEDLRLRANRAGAAIGKVSERYLPQSHDPLAIGKTGRAAWVDSVLPKIDRSRYANADGSTMTEAQMRAFLNEAYMTLATDGANKPAAQGGSGSVANRNSKERQIHFKDAASWLEYHAEFGGRGALEMIDSSVRRLSDQIALLETMGPNPQETVNGIYNLEADRLNAAGDTKALTALDKDKALTDYLLGELTGANRRLSSGKVAAFWRNLRAAQSLKLGAAYITSLTDHATLHLTARLWKMSNADVLVESLRGLNPAADKAHRTQIVNAGLMADGAIGRMEMLGAEVSRSTIIEKAANVQMKLSLLNWATRMRRENFSVVFANTLGSMADRLSFADLNAVDHLAIREYGITAENWNVWKLAKKEDWGRGATMLTAPSILKLSDADIGRALGKALSAADARSVRERATTALLGMVSNESKMAVLEPSRLTRAKINRFVGDSEIARAMLQFKSFPIALIAQHIVRGINLPGAGGKIAYLSALGAGMTIMGGVSMTAADILAGKNPRPLLDPSDKYFAKSWGAAALKGGALGIFGDFLFAQQTRYGSQVGSIVTGPAIGDLLTLGDIALQARSDIAAGEAPDIGAKSFNVAKSYIPLSGLWYTRGLFNHAFVQNVQEMMNPGYMRRMQARTKRDYGQTMYWRPGEALPSQPPDLTQLTGN